MSALTDLRREAAKAAPGSDLQCLLSWAERHIGDQFDQIHDLIAEEGRLRAENEMLRDKLRALGVDLP